MKPSPNPPNLFPVAYTAVKFEDIKPPPPLPENVIIYPATITEVKNYEPVAPSFTNVIYSSLNKSNSVFTTESYTPPPPINYVNMPITGKLSDGKGMNPPNITYSGDYPLYASVIDGGGGGTTGATGFTGSTGSTGMTGSTGILEAL